VSAVVEAIGGPTTGQGRVLPPLPFGRRNGAGIERLARFSSALSDR
jgi:hypothetical protein